MPMLSRMKTHQSRLLSWPLGPTVRSRLACWGVRPVYYLTGLVTVTALVLPAILVLAREHSLPGVGEPRHSFGSQVEHLSLAVSFVMIAIYLAGLLFSLRTHRDLFRPAGEEESPRGWSLRRAMLMLAVAGVLVGLMSEVLVGS